MRHDEDVRKDNGGIQREALQSRNATAATSQGSASDNEQCRHSNAARATLIGCMVTRQASSGVRHMVKKSVFLRSSRNSGRYLEQQSNVSLSAILDSRPGATSEPRTRSVPAGLAVQPDRHALRLLLARRAQDEIVLRSKN